MVSPEFSKKTFLGWEKEYQSLVIDDARLQNDDERRENFYLIDSFFGATRIRSGNVSAAKILLDKYVGITRKPATKKEVAILCAIIINNDRMNGMHGHYGELAKFLKKYFGVEDVSGDELQRLEWEVQKKLSFDTNIMSLGDVISGILYGMIPEIHRERTEDWRKIIFDVALRMAEIVLRAQSAVSLCMMDNVVGSIYWAFFFVGIEQNTNCPSLCAKFNADVRDLLVKAYQPRPEQTLHPGGQLQPLALLGEIMGRPHFYLKTCFLRVVTIAAKQINEEEESRAMNRRFPPSPSEAFTNCSGSSRSCSLSSNESLTSHDEPTEMNN